MAQVVSNCTKSKEGKVSDLFEANEDDVLEITEEFEGVDVEVDEVEKMDVDARRRLENLLDEKRLMKELDDYMDY